MNLLRKMPLGLMAMILCVCTQAKGADFFNADWILTGYKFQQGEETFTKGPGPLREDMEEDDLGVYQPALMGGWRIGKDGFCALLYPKSIKQTCY